MNVKQLAQAISYSMTAHDERAKKSEKRFRKWNITIPYGIHPTWCAMTFLTECVYVFGPQEQRIMVLALLYHDIREDTNAELPADTPELVRVMVNDLTFESSEHEMIEIWERAAHRPHLYLLKLYDKVSNLLDGCWMPDIQKRRYKEYTLALAEKVVEHYGELNIVLIARAICS